MQTRARQPPYLHGIVLMSVCANAGSDRPSRLAAYTGHVMISARLRTRARRSPYLHRSALMSVCANFGPDRSSRLAAYTGQHNTEQRPF
jgi:hypothetical protein